ncbi:MAG: cysteine--tRNA ligase [Verrucomicrobia bacterium]|nr:cysteine--tRNA ligase [Verrucomicrobiota bacterium]
MGLRFLNTLTRTVEPFVPLDPAGREVRMYTCGPTIYNYAHIGNLRSYMFEDLIHRHLELRGFTVKRVMNITDVDDKTIRDSRRAGLSLGAFTEVYLQAFYEDLKTLRIKPADAYPRATSSEYIERMIRMIATLIERGHAYQAEDGSVYFRISSFPAYGRLANLDLDELRPSGRVASDEYEKESVADFALWKAWDEADGDVGWESPWGRGRPGWHIECSAMATALLGDQLDIHCGGVDNIFPHHEAEIAQTECCTGVPFVKYWLHGEHLLVEGQKMSKSLGNFYTLRDLLDKGWSGREVRFALLRVNYRLQLNFTFAGLEDARTALGRIDEWVARLTDHARAATGPESHPAFEGERFEAALDDDLNISAALGVLFEAIRETNRALDAGILTPGQARAGLDWWSRLNHVLVLDTEAAAIPAVVTALLEERQQARLAKEWKRSDELRDQIAALGWEVKDTKEGVKLTKKAA